MKGLPVKRVGAAVPPVNTAARKRSETSANTRKIARPINQHLTQIIWRTAEISPRFVEQVQCLDREAHIAVQIVGKARFKHRDIINDANASRRSDKLLEILAAILEDALQVEIANLIIGLTREDMLGETKQV